VIETKNGAVMSIGFLVLGQETLEAFGVLDKEQPFFPNHSIL
jgi:hypothetical protein